MKRFDLRYFYSKSCWSGNICYPPSI